MRPISAIFIVAILVFGVVIHELGHALAARKFGVDVQELGIGFGPTVRAAQYKDTKVIIRLIWLGGYVKLNNAVFDQLETWKKNIVFAMGPIFNFLTAFVGLWGFWACQLHIDGFSWYTIPFKSVIGVILTFQHLFDITIESIAAGGVGALVGPIGIIGLTAQEPVTPFVYFLGIAVMIFFSLGFINLFPIPGLDGGQILLTSVKLPKAKYVRVTNAGLYCMILLSALITGWDVYRLATGFWGV